MDTNINNGNKAMEAQHKFSNGFSERLAGILVMIFAAGGLSLILYGSIMKNHGTVVPGFELIGTAIVILTMIEIHSASFALPASIKMNQSLENEK
ncbi:MAG: hypothetical protein P1U42_11245 [Phycisphaerales bacterium]|nr:hypothetical protein [Phycisphaerales bacterium]